MVQLVDGDIKTREVLDWKGAHGGNVGSVEKSSHRRKLVRDAGLDSSRQPECKHNRAGKTARGLRRRHRREKLDHPSQVRPTSKE